MVIALDKRKQPLGFVTPKRARKLLEKKRAVVHKIYPFTIRIKDIDSRNFKTKEYKLKIDPGSKVTGLSIVDNNNVYFLAELEHRGQIIKSNLETRKGARRNRRQRETRYRRCKWINHYLKKGSKYKTQSPRKEGWLPPSIESIENNIINFIKKYSKLINITKVSIENVRFDMQLLDNPNIQGVEYQQGELWGYEVKEYLLNKYGNTCQYCKGTSKDTVLEVEHMISKSNGGSNSIKNLNISCRKCNQDKGSLNLDEWLIKLKKSKSKLSQERVKCVEKVLDGKTLITKNYGAWVNSYKNRLVQDTKQIPNVKEIELASGGQTKFNRTKLNLPKTHYYDSLCVGNVAEGFIFKTPKVFKIKACGRGSRFRGRTNACGIINKNLPRQKEFFCFQTGDIVKAIVAKGKKQGTYLGRVAVRSSGYFNITTKDCVIQGIKYSNCTKIQRCDGYSYQIENRAI